MTVLAGIAVLIGAVAATNRVRRYDSVVLKLLGASGRQVLAVQALEYLLLSLLLAIIALAIGGGGGWFVVTRVLQLPWAPNWRVIAATLATASAVTLGTGLLGSLPVLRESPAGALRSE